MVGCGVLPSSGGARPSPSPASAPAATSPRSPRLRDEAARAQRLRQAHAGTTQLGHHEQAAARGRVLQRPHVPCRRRASRRPGSRAGRSGPAKHAGLRSRSPAGSSTHGCCVSTVRRPQMMSSCGSTASRRTLADCLKGDISSAGSHSEPPRISGVTGYIRSHHGISCLSSAPGGPAE